MTPGSTSTSKGQLILETAGIYDFAMTTSVPPPHINEYTSTTELSSCITAVDLVLMPADEGQFLTKLS